MNKRKLLTLAMSLCVLAIVAIGGTLAYFVDSAEVTNTFTIGNVDIELLESQYHRVNAGMGYTTKEEPINGGYLWASNVELKGDSTNTPDAVNSDWTSSFFSDAQIEEDAKTYKDKDGYFDTHANNMVPGSNVRKNPYIKNTSKNNDVYVRLIAKVPVNLFKILDNGASYWVDSAMDTGNVTSKAVAYYYEKGQAGFIADANNPYKKGEYYEFDFTYEEKLAPGAITFWNAWSNIAIDKNATNEDLKGVTTFDVIFEAHAIQADTFANGTAAFVAYDAQVNK